MARRLGVFGVLAVLAVAPGGLPAVAPEDNCTPRFGVLADIAFATPDDGVAKQRCLDRSLIPTTIKPITSKPPSLYEAPARPLVADYHIVSTELGFAKGVGPAPGIAVTYHGK